MELFIAGICGTFMAGLAQLALSLGHKVTGCDEHVYPPMSDVLADAGIVVLEGYDPTHIPPGCDCVIIGNALSRGNPLVEHVLAYRIPYTSGPQWLGDHLLRDRNVISVAGTHGKTSTASMVAWILEYAGRSPGFLIGGKPANFRQSARIGDGDWFVIEADEYDTAFFDKRSKFVHYHSDVAVLGNLEFDHADIFDDLAQIKRQFHHLVRTVPGNGLIVANQDDENIASVLLEGSWSPLRHFSTRGGDADWAAEAINPDASQFSLISDGELVGEVRWTCIGDHNMQNGLAAIAAACAAGVEVDIACQALGEFRPTARRLQKLFDQNQIILFEDFAHHPTAIKSTLDGARAAYPDAWLVALIEPRSNTMRMAIHTDEIGGAIAAADEALFYLPTPISWDPEAISSDCPVTCIVTPEAAVAAVSARSRRPLVVVAMSNGSFDRVPAMIQETLTSSL